MKNHLTKLRASFAVLALLILFILGCTKDFDDVIIDDFGFSFTEEHDEEGVVFGSTRTSFILTPKKDVSTTKHFMKYKILDGNGTYLKMDGEAIQQNDTLSLDRYNFDFNYRHMSHGIL